MIPHRAFKHPSKPDQLLVQADGLFGKQEMTLNLSSEQYLKGMKDYQTGMFVQQAFPTLNADEREFLVTGMTPEQWDTIMPPEEDEEECSSTTQSSQ